MILPRAGSPGSTQGRDSITLSILTILLTNQGGTSFLTSIKNDTQVADSEYERSQQGSITLFLSMANLEIDNGPF